jgi:transposase
MDQERLKFAEYKTRVLEERVRLIQFEKYGPGSEKLSDAQLELLELEPGVNEVESSGRERTSAIKTPPEANSQTSWPAGTAGGFAAQRANHPL